MAEYAKYYISDSICLYQLLVRLDMGGRDSRRALIFITRYLLRFTANIDEVKQM